MDSMLTQLLGHQDCWFQIDALLMNLNLHLKSLLPWDFKVQNISMVTNRIINKCSQFGKVQNRIRKGFWIKKPWYGIDYSYYDLHMSLCSYVSFIFRDTLHHIIFPSLWPTYLICYLFQFHNCTLYFKFTYKYHFRGTF